jgi:hypothetical protein
MKKYVLVLIAILSVGVSCKPGAKDFSEFLRKFVGVCCSNNNLDSLLEVRSPLLAEFVNNEIGIGSSNNPGTACIGGMYKFETNEGAVDSSLLGYFTMNLPNLSKCKIFANKLPRDGFCEESADPDGIYYKSVKKIGPFVDINDKEDFALRNIQLSAKYKNAQIMYVQILLDKWIVKKMYFIKADGKWWLVFLDKCDCSA